MPLIAQEVESKYDAEGARALMEVLKFEEFKIAATTADRRVGWRDDRVMAEYIYNRCSSGLEKNIFWEEGETSVLMYFVS